MIYAVVNSKGGVGKSTTAVHLATMLARQGPALLLDGDPQASAASWAAWRRESNTDLPSPTTSRLLGRALIDEGKNLSKGFDNTVIDAGGRDNVGLRSALLLADRAIVPVGASVFDSAAMTDFLDLLSLAKDINPKLDAKFLLARLDTRTKDATEMLEYLEEQELPAFTSRIYERVAYRRVLPSGSTVHETKKDNIAIKEMNSLFKEVTS